MVASNEVGRHPLDKCGRRARGVKVSVVLGGEMVPVALLVVVARAQLGGTTTVAALVAPNFGSTKQVVGGGDRAAR